MAENDHIEVNAYTRGVVSPDMSSAVRSVRHEGAKTPELIVAAAKSMAAGPHPFDPALPLATVNAQFIRPDLAYGTALYRRIPGISTPYRHASEMYSVASGVGHFKYYRPEGYYNDATGRPNKIQTYSLPNGELEGYAWWHEEGILVFNIHTVLDFDPSSAVVPQFNTVNNAATTIGEMCGGGPAGFSFPKWTAWLKGMYSRSTPTREGVSWAAAYQVIYAPGRWVEERVFRWGFGSPPDINPTRVAGTIYAINASHYAAEIMYAPKQGVISLPTHTPVDLE